MEELFGLLLFLLKGVGLAIAGSLDSVFLGFVNIIPGGGYRCVGSS